MSAKALTRAEASSKKRAGAFKRKKPIRIRIGFDVEEFEWLAR